LKDNRIFARVFLGPTWVQVGFCEPLLQRTPAAAGKLSDGQHFKPGRCGARSPECVPLRLRKVSRPGSGRYSMSEIEVNSMFVYHGRFAVRRKPFASSVSSAFSSSRNSIWMLLYLGALWLATR
jgi:hypothetical protein